MSNWHDSDEGINRFCESHRKPKKGYLCAFFLASFIFFLFFSFRLPSTLAILTPNVSSICQETRTTKPPFLGLRCDSQNRLMPSS